MGIVCIDGVAREENDPAPYDVPRYYFNSGVYETLRTVRGKLYNWEAHRIRLRESAMGMGFELRPDFLQTLKVQAEKTVVQNASRWDPNYESKVRIQVDPELHYYIQVTPLIELSDATLRKGIDVATVHYERKNPELKSINADFVHWVDLMKKDKGVQELLLVNRKDEITEGSVTNVFLVFEEGKLVTPDRQILKGTARARVIQMAQRLGHEVEFRSITLEDVFKAREMFVCSVMNEAVPVVKVNGREVGTGHPGFVSAQIRKALKDSRLKS